MSELLMGIPGVGEVYPGTHVCALFSGPAERDRLLISFMQEGLRHGDQCVCFIDGLEPAATRQRMYGAARPGDTRRAGRLSLYSAPDAHLRGGVLSPKQAIARLVSHPTSPADRRRPLLRAAGEMSHTSEGTGSRVLFLYESAVTLILAAVPAVFLCLHDIRRLGPGMLAEVVKMHSQILLDGAVLYNPRSVTVHDGHSRPGDQWSSLTGTEVRIAHLVGTGKTNRATADELIVSQHTVDAHLKHIYLKLGIHSRAELAVLSFRHGSPST